MKSLTKYLVASVLPLGLIFSACTSKTEETPNAGITEPAPASTPEAAPVATAAPVEVATPAPAEAPAAAVSFQAVFFDFDSYALRGDQLDVLRKIAERRKGGAAVKVQIEGHCDERGSNEYNLALGERRARSVQEFLISEGVAAANLSTISYGEERPSSQGSGEDTWSKNRRAEFSKL